MNDWNQKFGNAFIGMLLMGFVMAFIMLFFGCEITLKTEEVETEEVKEDSSQTADYFNAADWKLF